MRNIILASHGEFSKGLKDSVSMIVGDLPIRSGHTACIPPVPLRTTWKK